MGDGNGRLHVIDSGDCMVDEYIRQQINLRGRSQQKVADELNISRWKVRKVLDKADRGVTKQLELMKNYVIECYEGGMASDVIAERLKCSHCSILSALTLWGVEIRKRDKSERLPSISLNDLKSNWVDVDQIYTVTVGRKPKFYLIPIEE